MNYDSRNHHRRTIRLRDYDYGTAGAYFVTVCTHERRCIFEDAELKSVAEDVWRTVLGTSGGFIDDFIVMPNHVHGIVWIAGPTAVGARQPGGPYEQPRTPTNALPSTNEAVASPLRTTVGPRSGAGSVAGSSKSAAGQPGGSFEKAKTPINVIPNTNRAVASPVRNAFGPPSGSLGAIVGSFKSATAKRINNLRETPGAPVWQRNYYEHVIRDEDDLNRIRQHIRDNPAKWADDPDNPANM